MQNGEQNLMMPNELDALRTGPFQDIHPAAILRLFIHVDGYEAIQAVAEIMRDIDGFDEDLRENDSAAQIEPYALLHGADDRAKAAKIDHAGFAQSGARDMGMHVHDVRAQGDVDRARNAGPISGQHHAAVGIGAVEAFEVLSQGPS